MQFLYTCGIVSVVAGAALGMRHFSWTFIEPELFNMSFHSRSLRFGYLFYWPMCPYAVWYQCKRGQCVVAAPSWLYLVWSPFPVWAVVDLFSFVCFFGNHFMELCVALLGWTTVIRYHGLNSALCLDGKVRWPCKRFDFHFINIQLFFFFYFFKPERKTENHKTIFCLRFNLFHSSVLV